MDLDTWANNFHNVIIEWNGHKSAYDTVRGYLRSLQEELPKDVDDWKTLVTVHVYPRSPVGFVIGFGRTLSEAMASIDAVFIVTREVQET